MLFHRIDKSTIYTKRPKIGRAKTIRFSVLSRGINMFHARKIKSHINNYHVYKIHQQWLALYSSFSSCSAIRITFLCAPRSKCACLTDNQQYIVLQGSIANLIIFIFVFHFWCFFLHSTIHIFKTS